MKNWLLKRLAQEIDAATQQETKPLNFPAPIDITYLKPDFKSKNLELVKRILFILNAGIYYLTSGVISFKELKDSNFSLDTSRFSQDYVKQVLALCHLFYQYLDGKNTVKEMLSILNGLRRIDNSFLTNFISGNFNSKLLEHLRLLDSLDH